MKAATWCRRRTLLYLLVGSLIANLSLVYILHSNETPNSSGLHAGKIAFLGAEWRHLGSLSNPLAAHEKAATPIPHVDSPTANVRVLDAEFTRGEQSSAAEILEPITKAATAEVEAAIPELDRLGGEHDDPDTHDIGAISSALNQERSAHSSDAICVATEIVAPIHWRIGQPIPVLLTANRGAPVDTAATVELLVNTSTTPHESRDGGTSSTSAQSRSTSQGGLVLACCQALLHRGRGSCLLEWGACSSSTSTSITSRDNVTVSSTNAGTTADIAAIAGTTAWLRITDAAWLVGGQQPKHPLDHSPFVGSGSVGSYNRTGSDYSHVGAVLRAVVCPQTIALMQPLLPAAIPPSRLSSESNTRTSSSAMINDHSDQNDVKSVRYVMGGNLDAYRTVWGPYEEVVVESSSGLVVGGQNSSSIVDPKGGGPSLTILEGTTVYLQPGAELVVKAGARLLLYGDRRKPVTFMPTPRPDQRWRHTLNNRDSKTKSEQRGSSRQALMSSAHYGPRGFAPSVSGAAWALTKASSNTRSSRSSSSGSSSSSSSSSSSQEKQQNSEAREGGGETGAWGELRVEGGARLVAMHTIFTGGGGLGPVDRVFGHSGSRPVLRAGDLGANAPSVNGPPHLTLIGGAIVDCPGKAIASSDAIVTLRGVLLSRVDTGGEHRRSAVTMQRCHVVEIPALARFHHHLRSSSSSSATKGESHNVILPSGSRAWTDEDVDDSDGIYLKGVFGSHKRSKNEARQGSLIQDCTFAHGADDAIDINGATVTIHRTLIHGWAHEGVAASGGGGGSQNAKQDMVLVLVKDSLIRTCSQGIEAGYGYPQVRVHRVMTENCGTAFRFGDGYNWKYQGRLTVTQSAAVATSKHQQSLWDWVWAKPPNAYTAASPRAKEAAIASVRAATPGTTDAGGNAFEHHSAKRGDAEVDEIDVEVALRGGHVSGDAFVQCSSLRRHVHSSSSSSRSSRSSKGSNDSVDKGIGMDSKNLDWIKATFSSGHLESNGNLARRSEFGCPAGISSPALLETWLVDHLKQALGGSRAMATSEASPEAGSLRDATETSTLGVQHVSEPQIHGFGPLDEPRFTEPAFVRGDCGEGLLADFSAAQASAEQWGAWAGKGWMKDTFPATLKAQRYDGPMAPLPLSPSLEEVESATTDTILMGTEPSLNTSRDDQNLRVVYARVKTHFLDRFERQYGFVEHENWHELPSHERSLVALSPDTAQVVRPSLELLSHLRHPNIARVLKLCGPLKQQDQQPLGLASSSGTGDNLHDNFGISNHSSIDSEEQRSFAAWSSARGFDFTFAQELAEGVAINHKSPPPKQKQQKKQDDRLSPSYEAPTELGLIDLAIELVTALVALHESPVGAVVHGDLKWSNIITHPTLPILKLIDFDNAIILGGDNPEQGWTMPARPIAFCCDMGKGHNHLAPECQKCQTLSTKMDVYVVGQRLLNFYDQQRINMYKQLGCVTSIYATSKLDNKSTAAACDPCGEDDFPLRSLVRNAPRIDSSYPGMIEVMAECLRLNPLKRPRMSQVLDALFAVRTRASLQPITVARRAAFLATTGLTLQLPAPLRQRKSKEPSSAPPILYFDTQRRDGADALVGWRKLLTEPFLGLEQSPKLHEKNHVSSSSSSSGSAKNGLSERNDVSTRSPSLWVVPGTVQLYSHSFLRGAGIHGCGLRFVGHANNLITSPWAEKFPSSSSSTSSSSPPPPKKGGMARDLSSARVMVKATHSDNGHFDDESLYREIKLFALDQLLGTSLALPCVGARVNLASAGLALAARALDSKAKAHTGRPPVPDPHKVSCLQPGPNQGSSDHSSTKSTRELSKDTDNNLSVTVDAAVCLYLDYASPQAIAGLAGASAAANQAAYANQPNFKPAKFKSVPTALAAAETWEGTPPPVTVKGAEATTAANSSPSSKRAASSKAIKSTRTPSFFASDDARHGSSTGSSNGNIKRPLYTPSHANAAEYAVVSFLANCAKSSHNHFALVKQKPPSSSPTQSLESLVMVDNDRCFVPNAVLKDLSDATAGADSAKNASMPEEHRERFTRWRRLLWSTCAWLGPAYDETRDHDASTATARNAAATAAAGVAGVAGVAAGGASGTEANDSGEGGGIGGVLGGGVQDLIARLRWHQGLGVLGATANEKPPTLSAALRDLLADDALASGLLSTDRKAFAELDGRVAELLNRVNECERALELRDFHRTRPFTETSTPQPHSSSSFTWRLDAALDGDHLESHDDRRSDRSTGNSGTGTGSQSTRPRCRPVSAGGPEVCSVLAPMLIGQR